MSEDGKRGVGHRPQATAPILDSTPSDAAIMKREFIGLERTRLRWARTAPRTQKRFGRRRGQCPVEHISECKCLPVQRSRPAQYGRARRGGPFVIDAFFVRTVDILSVIQWT